MSFTHTRGAPNQFFVITPNDGADLPQSICGIYIQTAGAVKITGAGDIDANAVIVQLPAGFSPMVAKKVWATGTGAVGTIVGGY